MLVNEKLYDKTIYNYSPNLIWYRVKQDFWEQEIRAIDATNVNAMYSKDYLNDIKNGEFKPVVALTYGEILKFDISYNEQKLTKFFYATYGE